MLNLDKIKQIRIDNFKSQEDMAILFGVSRSSYAMWESDNETFPIKRLIDFCDYFCVAFDYVFDFIDYNYLDLAKYNKSLNILRLKEFRKENKLTQVKLASILNTVHPVITNYENGKNIIATPFLYTICKKYGISADYLLGRVDSPKYIKKD